MGKTMIRTKFPRQVEKMQRKLAEEFLEMLVRPYLSGEVALPLSVVATRNGQSRQIRLDQPKYLVCVSDEGEEIEVDPFLFLDLRKPSDVDVVITDASGRYVEIPFRLVAENDTPDGHLFSLEVAEGATPDWQSRSESPH